MVDKKYLVIEQLKYSNIKDSWTIKFAELDEDTAFKKLVALNTLNDNKDKIYYIVNMEYLWARDNQDPLVLTDEVNNEDKQQKLF